MDNKSMTIPEGLSCGDCRMYPKCAMLIGVKRDATECDFFPVKFEPSPVMFAAHKQDVATLRAEVARLTAELSGKTSELQQARDAVCQWSKNEDDWDHVEWNGACGACWQFEDGGPVENEMAYCPTCGKRLVVMPTPPEQENDNV